MPDEPLRLRGVLTTRGTLTGRLTGNKAIAGRLSINRIIQNETDTYEGPYEVTPTQETQYLYTDQKLMADNVTINPIPSNYGLITWDGSVLTVS